MMTNSNNNKRTAAYHREEISDAKKLADKHLADPDHVITEEDMRKIKVGITGEADAPTRQAVNEAEDRVADHKTDSEEDTAPGAQKTTPWDVLEPE